jgi:hypothetical protein
MSLMTGIELLLALDITLGIAIIMRLLEIGEER